MRLGRSGCSASRRAARCRGRAIRFERPGRRHARRSWSTCCGPSSTPGTAPGWPPDSAGRGASRGRTAPSFPTSSSATGRGRGTCAASAPSAGRRPSALWATDPAGFGQVGCVYTAQGFEYDWNGVIIGPDLVWRDGGWVAIRTASKDPDFRSRTKVSDQRVRPAGPQRLQGAADPRDDRHGHLLAPTPKPARCSGRWSRRPPVLGWLGCVCSVRPIPVPGRQCGDHRLENTSVHGRADVPVPEPLRSDDRRGQPDSIGRAHLPGGV